MSGVSDNRALEAVYANVATCHARGPLNVNRSKNSANVDFLFW